MVAWSAAIPRPRKMRGVMMTASLVIMCGGAYAQGAIATTGDLQAAAWAYSCATCHGVRQSAVQGIPTLAGMKADQIVKAMQAFAADERQGLLKRQIARGYDDEQLRRIGEWYANLPQPDAARETAGQVQGGRAALPHSETPEPKEARP